jgi:hypothetical protein
MTVVSTGGATLLGRAVLVGLLAHAVLATGHVEGLSNLTGVPSMSASTLKSPDLKVHELTTTCLQVRCSAPTGLSPASWADPSAVRTVICGMF